MQKGGELVIFDNAIEQVIAEKDNAEVAIVKLGTVASVSGGRAKIQHYGEGTPSNKEYTYIDGYFPEVGDKVAMLPQANTYIIIGKVMDTAPVEKYATIEYVDDTFLVKAYKNKLEDGSEDLTFTGNVLTPKTNNQDSLGSSTRYFKELYIKKLVLDGVEFTEITMDRIVVKSGNNTYSLIATVSSGNVTLTPSTNDSWALGTKTYHLKEAWLGIFRGDWKSGNTTERSLSWNSSNALVPDTNNSVDLGSSSYGFKQIFADALVGVKSQYQSNSANNIAWSSASDILPNNNNVVNLGSSSKQFNKFYAKEIYLNGTLIDIAGITLDSLTTKHGTTSYTLKLSVKNAGASSQYELLEPSVNGKFDLGSSSYKLRDIYAASLSAAKWGDGTRDLSWNSSHALIPDTNNTIDLGTASLQYNKIYSKEIYVNGTKIDLSALEVSTLTSKDNSYVRTLKMTSSSSGASILPSLDNGFSLGSASYKLKEIVASTFTGDLNGKILDGSYNLSWDSSHNLYPSVTNFMSLGTSNKQYKNVYGQNLYVNGTAVSSDRRIKEDINALEEKHLAFFKALRPVQYKFKDGDSGRIHTGFIAQEVEDAVREAGMTDKDMAVVVRDQDGKYYLRYEEIIAVQTKVIQDLMAKVDNLESRLAKLERYMDERR